ncbi:TPA: autotransporter outer membrane beta-barrel domain-containing protein [Escherichia coli]|nr:autotransporter outer membrane beta-barrel domain-containing protein [Escherichia coli]EKQ0424529.1 autotransporter outer membrane beta-barrel domain-containing protein [Escherichia coli]HBD4685049.1 autotransporter outer membrane beta-barrel domain-containing protein [Escherichia coli]HCN7774505.1 autotransporter outer membrane beta-barrel domain-containing protein [Escherichia coli]
MNKIYKVIWNHSTQQWDVVSELTGNKKKCKSARLNLALAAALFTGSMAVNCSSAFADISLDSAWRPAQNNNLVGAETVNGTTENIIGPISVVSGSSGLVGMTVDEAKAEGYITAGDDLTGLLYIDTGGRTKALQYWDAATGAYRTVQVYDNDAFSQRAAGSSANELISGFAPDAGFFYKTRFVTVTNGGTANIDVGADFIGRYFKDTQLAVADGAGSTVNWNSENEFYLQAAATSTNGLTYTTTIDSKAYAGTFTDWQGQQHQVNSQADLQQYNDYLTQAIVDGKLTASQYETEFNRAIITTTHTYDVDRTAGGKIDPAIYQAGIGTLAVLEARNGGTARLSSTGKLTGILPSVGRGAGIIARSGGTGINEGIIDATGIAMRAYGNSTIVNDGTIYSGINNSKHGRHGEGMVAIDADSLAINNGVINIRPYKVATVNQDGINTAMLVAGGGEGINNGTINITADASVIDSKGLTRGISVGDGGSFTNASTGKITVGVAEDGSAAHSAVGSVAIEVAQGATRVINEGTILLGEGAQGNYGISASNVGAVNTVINKGTITVEGHDSDTPALNVGMFANNSTGLKNTGVINVNGLNSAGLQAINGGQIASDGTVNVGGVDISSGFRNYGAWVEGTGSRVDISGEISLTGDGAVGVFAKNGGDLILSGNGAVVFGGSNQVGFYVYGDGSTIHNTGNSVMDVSTENSTLFRIASGAVYRGGTGASSDLTASGKNSYALVATGRSDTGTASTVTSGGMTINLTGEGATAVLVEGGAQGSIDSNATINMDNASAIAGIADGNGYDISGNLINPKDKTTLLTAGAQLSSSQDKVTGYIARNGATLENTGNITFTGKNTTAIRVEEGAAGTNSGNITVQDGGVGLLARGSQDATTINNTGNLVLSGGNNANRTTGIKASGAATTVNMTAGTLDLQGQGAIGVEVSEQGTVNLEGTAIPKFAADDSGITDQIAFRIIGDGATINTKVAQGTLLEASGQRSVLFRIEDGAKQIGSLQMKTSGTGSRGIWATGKGSDVQAEAGSDFQILGDLAQGLYVTGGATATLKQGISVDLVGDGAVVAEVDGNEYALDGSITQTNTGSVITNEADISSPLNNAKGFITRNQGLLINSGNIDFTAGTDNIGVWVDNGRFENTGNRIAVNGVALFVEGAQSQITSTGGDIVAVDGEAAIKLGAGASLNLAGSGLGTIEGQKNAHGILLDTGAVGLVIDGAKINVNAAGAVGHGIENRAEIEGIQLTNTTEINVADGIGVRTSASLAKTNSGTINVDGSGIALAFRKADGSETDNNLDMSDSGGLVINLKGTGGTGIFANTKDGAVVKSGASVNVTQADGGSALVVNNAASEVVQSGNLISASLNHAVVDASKALSFTNTGQIKAASAAGTAMAFDDAVNTTVLNDSGAEIQGVVALNGGDNTFTNKGSITGTVSAKDGNNTLLFDDGSILTGEVTAGNGNNNVTLNGRTHVDQVIAGTGQNTFTIKGEGATWDLLDGGQGDSDSLIFDNAIHTLDSAAKIQNFEHVGLKNGSVVTLKEALVLTDGGAGAGSVDIESGSELSITPATAGDFTFDPLLTGKGTLSAQLDADTSAFEFSHNVGDQFAGTLKLGTSSFALEGLNTKGLTHAMLVSETGNITTVGSGVQRIGGLGFSGGTLNFGSVSPGDIVAGNRIETSAAGTLDLRGQGTIQVTMPVVVNDIPVVDTRKNLLEQDDAQTLVKLVDAKGTVIGTGGQLQLVDENGQVISHSQTFDVTQGGEVVAQGNYDYKMLGSSDGINGDGLYIGYGLKSLNLQGTGDKALVLTPRANAQGLQSDLGAQLTGTGDLAIDAVGQVVTLSNGGNNYTGDTLVRSGTLQMANDNVLGATGSLNVASNAVFRTDGYSQTVGALQTETGAHIQLDSGSVLTVSGTQRQPGDDNGGIIENNVLTGDGTLAVTGSNLTVHGTNIGFSGNVSLTRGSLVEMNGAQGLGSLGTVSFESLNDRLAIDIADGSGVSSNLSKSLSGEGSVGILNTTDLTLSGDNSQFSGEFRVQKDAALRASDEKHLGTGLIDSEGVTWLTASDSWLLKNDITGSGALVKQGAGNLIINHELAYTGDTTVENGVLIVGDDSVTSAADATLSGSGNIHVLNGGTLSGQGTVAGHVNNQGTLASLNALSGYENAEVSNFTVGSLTNTGVIRLAGGKTGNTLTVNGDYTGGGTLIINTVLGDDTSATDKLIVTGNTSGDTGVVVNNVRGQGAQTADGIEIVHVGGQSDGNFRLENRAVAGAWEYFLHKGNAGGTDGNWYLRSELPPEPGTKPETKPETKPTPDKPVQTVYRPEAGSYISNIAAANTLFNTRMHDREGETYYTDVFTGEKKATSMWMRHVGGHNRWKDSSSQLNTQSNRYVVQLGGSIAQWTDGQERLQLGIMAGYGNEKSSTTSSVSGYKSKGSISGYSTGLYGTWQQNDGNDTGAYVDTWIQYGWFNNTVNGEKLAAESWKSRGFTGSVEAGYTFKAGEFTGSQGSHYDWYIQPQSQLTWMNVRAGEHKEKNGTKVQLNGDGNIQSRLGVRTYLKGKSASDDNKAHQFEPFVEVNWIHNTQDWSVKMDNTVLSQDGATNIAEVKTGVQGKLSDNLNIWGNVGVQVGDKGYSDAQAMLGIKYTF